MSRRITGSYILSDHVNGDVQPYGGKRDGDVQQPCAFCHHGARKAAAVEEANLNGYAN
jgi:hypothetical protein